MTSTPISSFRAVPKTGVIYVMAKAAERGFVYGHPDWSNLGQGAPETTHFPEGAKRIESIAVDVNISEYGPVPGIMELRDAVADHYNRRYRRGMKSKYTAENVAISAGGRVGLTRIAAALGTINLGHFLPDYTAYEELLDLFKAFVPIPIVLPRAHGFRMEISELKREIVGRGLGALLISNPCNPTGQVIYGEELNEWLTMARQLGCTMIFDEFYSHYLYGAARAGQMSLSAAGQVEDVDRDPVLVVNGLTKNWRYPGLRLSWTLAPREVITRLASAGSFLDGGAPHPIQRAAIPLLDPDSADQEARTIQTYFSKKRSLMMDSIRDMGFHLPGYSEPEGGFYCFPSLQNLPEPLRDGMQFFKHALERQVITVPGVFFDVNPGHRRRHIPSRLRQYVRLSFGPSEAEVRMGLERLADLIDSFR